MEAIRYNPDRVMGIEVLSFEAAELERVKGDVHSFTTIGTLNLVYFRDYLRFVLYLNDWKCVLLDRLSIIAFDPLMKPPVCYLIPTDDGAYLLKLTKVPHTAAIQNFEAILRRNCDFAYKTELQRSHLRAASPEDRLRGVQTERKAPQSERGTRKMSTDSLTTLKDEKLRKRDMIKREVIKTADSLSRGIRGRNVENVNLTHIRAYEDLRDTPEELAPAVFLWRQDVEKTIVECQRAVGSNYLSSFIESRSHIESDSGRKSFIDVVKTGIQEIAAMIGPHHTQDLSTEHSVRGQSSAHKDASIGNITTSEAIAQEAKRGTINSSPQEKFMPRSTLLGEQTPESKSSLMDKVKTKLNFHEDIHTERRIKPQEVEKLMAHFPLETRFNDRYNVEPHQPATFIERVKANLPFIGKTTHSEESLGTTTQHHYPRETLTDKIKSKLPIVVGQAHHTGNHGLLGANNHSHSMIGESFDPLIRNMKQSEAPVMPSLGDLEGTLTSGFNQQEELVNKDRFISEGKSEDTPLEYQRQSSLNERIRNAIMGRTAHHEVLDEGSQTHSTFKDKIVKAVELISNNVHEGLQAVADSHVTRENNSHMTPPNFSCVEKVENVVTGYKYTKDDQAYEIIGDTNEIIRSDKENLVRQLMADTPNRLSDNRMSRREGSLEQSFENPIMATNVKGHEGMIHYEA